MPLSGSAFWACVLPSEKTNELLCPSYELGTTGAFAIQSATLGSTSGFQQFGAWSLSVTPNANGTSGAVAGTWTASNGSAYTVSAYVRGVNGIPYMIGVGDSAGLNLLGSTAFTGGGTWHRYNYAFTEASGAVRSVVIRKTSGGDTNAYYVDGVQVEKGSLTTYLDGDVGGIWQGAAHASQSFRSGQDRSGGSVVALQDLGLLVDNSLGIGMPPLENSSQSFAILDGAEYQRTRAAQRAFTLPVTMLPSPNSLQGIHAVRRTVINALKIDLVTPQQPTRFWYTGAGGTVQIDAVLDAGLEMGELDGFTEKAGVRFVAYDPYWYSTTQQGTSLAPRINLGSTNFIAWQDSRGQWGTLGANGTTVIHAAGNVTKIFALAYTPGTLFMGGIWGSVGGTVHNSTGMYFTDTNKFGTLAGGTLESTGTVFSLIQSAAGSLIIGGAFHTAGGTQAKSLAQWNGAWGTLVGGTINNGVSVNSMAYNQGGTLMLGGNFNLIGGTTTKSLGQYFNNAFGTLIGGTVDSAVEGIAIALDNRLLFTGLFGSVAGTACKGFGFWKDGTFGTVSGGIGTGGGPIGFMIALGPNGVAYIGGAFDLATDAAPGNSIVQYNGVTCTPLGSGLLDSAGGNTVRAIAIDQASGDMLVGGAFGTVGGVVIPDGLARYTNGAWIGADIDFSGAGTVLAIARTPTGTTYAAGDFFGSAVAASVAPIVNYGMAEAHPVIRIRNTSAGTARLYQLVNATTNSAIYFNLILQALETVTLDLTPGARSFQSSYQGNVFGRILPASNLAQWRLLPGTNYVSFFSDSDSLVNSIYWNARHHSADAGTTYP